MKVEVGKRYLKMSRIPYHSMVTVVDYDGGEFCYIRKDDELLMTHIDDLQTYENGLAAFKESITCPYCGEATIDPREMPERGTACCKHCNETFRYHQNVIVTYSSQKIEEAEE